MPAAGPTQPEAAIDPSSDENLTPRVGSHRREGQGKRRWILAATAAVLLIAGGVVAYLNLGTGNSARSVTGTFSLTDDATAGAGCVGTGADSGLGPGTPVTLTGPNGRRIATSKLSAGTASNGVCTYKFQFDQVPTNLSTYSAAVASQPPTSVSRSALQANGWIMALRYGPPTTTVTGTLDLLDLDTEYAGCVGQDGYSDISEGASVIVTDQSGRILGSAALEAGTPLADTSGCEFSFSVPNVREDEQEYAVEISHRGKVVHSAADMRSSNWNFALTLG